MKEGITMLFILGMLTGGFIMMFIMSALQINRINEYEKKSK